MYARLDADDEQRLLRRRKELDELSHYPTTERVLTAAAKVAMATLAGGSTIAGLLVFASTTSILTVVFLGIGSFVYAIKAIRDAHKKRQEEKKLTKDIINIREQMREQFTDDFRLTLNRLINLSKYNHLSEEETERLYKHLFELKEALSIVFSDLNAIPSYKTIVDNGIEEVGKQVRQFRCLTKHESCLPDAKYGVISLQEPSQEDESLSVSRIAKKAGNRVLSFMAGASSGAGICMSIAAFCFGISNPVGWALVGIVAVSCVVGLISVAIDYHFSRREENTIKSLQQVRRELGILHTGMGILKQTIASVCSHTQTSAGYRHLQEEAVELRRENAELRYQLEEERERRVLSPITLRQPATVFGAGAQTMGVKVTIPHSLELSDKGVRQRR
jgi:uncharacterized membrane protein